MCSTIVTVLLRWRQHFGKNVQVRWWLDERLRSIKFFSVHTPICTLKKYLDIKLYDMTKSIPCLQWPGPWYLRLNSIDVTDILMYEACICRVAIKRSTVLHFDSWFGHLPTTRFETREVVGYYYGTLVYAHLGSKLRNGRVYGDKITSASSDGFLTWAVCLTDKIETRWYTRRLDSTSKNEYSSCHGRSKLTSK